MENEKLVVPVRIDEDNEVVTVPLNCPVHGSYMGRLYPFLNGVVVGGPCPECDRLRREKNEQYRRARFLFQAGALESLWGARLIPEVMLDLTLETFISRTKREAEAYKEIRQLVDAFGKQKVVMGILLAGKGRKQAQHLAVGALLALQLKEIQGLYCSATGILDRVRRTWVAKDSASGGKIRDDDVLRCLIDVPILVIDGLGEHQSYHKRKSSQEIFSRAIEQRLSLNHPTIIYTPHDSETLQAIVGSGIVEMLKSYYRPYILNFVK